MPTSARHITAMVTDNVPAPSAVRQPLSSLDMPVSALAGVGPKVAEQLVQLIGHYAYF